jgi:hypothetical protein
VIYLAIVENQQTTPPDQTQPYPQIDPLILTTPSDRQTQKTTVHFYKLSFSVRINI